MEFNIDENDIERIATRLHSMLQATTASSKQPDSIIMNVDDLAVFLRVEKSWVYKQVQLKSIPHFHAGKYPRFKSREIDHWIVGQSMPSTCLPYPKLKRAA